ncbi:MAG: nitrogen regulation protein NR(II) [Gammaproteobacteria bacterium]|jgi:two-component system nitrogen regulation sensor histidine kinase GlnL
MSETNPLQTILDNLHAAVLVINQDLGIECMNPSAEHLFQISSKRAMTRSIVKLVPGEPEFHDRLARSLISGHPFTVYDTGLQNHDGTVMNVDYSASPIAYRPAGKFLLLEFTRLNSFMKISKEETLIHQHDATRSLLRNLAHEIKNPLGGIRGSAQLLDRELDASDREFTRIIIREADRLQNLVDRMLGPKSLPVKEKLNIHKVLEHIRQLVRAEAESITFTADYDPSLPDLHADEAMMIQALLNITRNAVAALNGEGQILFRTRPRRNCSIRSRTYPLVAQIDIIDNGEGIPKDLTETLFFPMVTGRAEGTGLGLSISQSLVQQHNGLIEFTSKPGETCFTILIPLENGHD